MGTSKHAMETSKHAMGTGKGRVKVTHEQVLCCINGNEFKPADNVIKKYLAKKKGGFTGTVP